MNIASLQLFFEAFPFAFIAVIPVLTMKSWAEERKLKSEEILFSLPFSEWELVLGKFLSCFFLILVMAALTLPVPLSLVPLGHFDLRVILTEYFGVLLLGASASALGLFLSSISKSQAAAFLGTAAVLIVITLLNNFTPNMSPGLAAFVNFISLTFHFESFSRGLLDTRNIAFFALSAGLFLFLNVQVLIFRKWK